MNKANSHSRILAFLHGQRLTVIATTGGSSRSPESALIAFAEDADLCLYFQTGEQTRKARNLQQNPHVSFVIGLTMQDLITVQYEGRVERLSEAAELEICKQRFIAKDSPTTAAHFDRPSTIFFKVYPTWIGYSDYSGRKPEVIEVKFD